ncbi:MAG TPA: hypothetical protein HA230_05225 [Candidatus Aenigmarchaeota archaeon]|nr:hypothetical protein [Candidatus Aenigmarchaeota archaeon]
MKLLMLLLFLAGIIINIAPVYAHCPLCTAATGAAVAVTRLYGIDDMIIGSLIGAFIISTALWFNNVLLKRNHRKAYLPMQQHIISLASFLLTAVSFYIGGLFNSPVSAYLVGVDKLFLGLLFGTFLTLFGFELHQIIRKKHGKNHLPMQAIWIVMALIIIFNAAIFLMAYFRVI